MTKKKCRHPEHQESKQDATPLATMKNLWRHVCLYFVLDQRSFSSCVLSPFLYLTRSLSLSPSLSRSLSFSREFSFVHVAFRQNGAQSVRRLVCFSYVLNLCAFSSRELSDSLVNVDVSLSLSLEQQRIATHTTNRAFDCRKHPAVAVPLL